MTSPYHEFWRKQKRGRCSRLLQDMAFKFMTPHPDDYKLPEPGEQLMTVGWPHLTVLDERRIPQVKLTKAQVKDLRDRMVRAIDREMKHTFGDFSE
jgi:hypothetical protein